MDMNRLVRYCISAGIATAVLLFVASFEIDLFSIVAIPIVYAATTSLILAHKEEWYESVRADKSDETRKTGAIGGGVGAFTLFSLSEISVAAVVTGFVLLSFGMAIFAADVAVRRRS